MFSVFALHSEVLWLAVVAMGVWGSSCGSYYGLSNLYIARVVGLQKLVSMHCAKSFVLALGSVTIGPFVGNCLMVFTDRFT